MTLKKLYILAYIIFWNSAAISQDTFFSNKYIDPAIYYGSILPQDNNIRYLVKDHIRGFQFNFGINTDGSRNWHKQLNYPRLGFGVYHSNLGNNDVFGFLTSAYGTAAIKTFKPGCFINIEHDITAGLGLLSTHYNLHKNSFDLAFGSPVVFFLQYALLVPVRINRQFEIYGGPCFTHVSLANLIEPNHGLHMPQVRIGSRFNFSPVNYKKVSLPVAKYDSVRHKFTIIAAFGFKQYSPYAPDKYWIYTINSEYCYKISRFFGAGGALNLYYDNSVRPILTELNNGEKARFRNLFHSTAHLNLQLYIGKLTFLIQPGYYIYENFGAYKKNINYKFGFGYRFTEHYSARILLKADWLAKADVLEYGIGYTF